MQNTENCEKKLLAFVKRHDYAKSTELCSAEGKTVWFDKSWLKERNFPNVAGIFCVTTEEHCTIEVIPQCN